MDLDDPLWNNNHFYHARAPWALDANVRRGIKSVLFLGQVEEEIQMLTQELDQSISWAFEHCKKIIYTIAKLEMEAEEPINKLNRFCKILKSFPMKGKLRLLCSELKRTLHKHKCLMVRWMVDLDILWKKTRSQHTKSHHPCFDDIQLIRDSLALNDIGAIDDALKALNLENAEEEPVEEQNEDKWVDDDEQEADPVVEHERVIVDEPTV
jgi:hypothetical protein